MKHVYLKIGQPIYCGNCGEARKFGYGPCWNCNHTPNEYAVDFILSNGIDVDENGLLVAASGKD